MAKWFKRNEGNVDRAARIALGIGLLSLTVVGPATLWGLVGLVPLMTGIAGTCPLYTVFGFSTCSTKNEGTPSPGAA